MKYCPICNKGMNYINNSHLKTHSLTPQEFKGKFPNFNFISDGVRNLLKTDKTNAILANKERKRKNLILSKEKFELESKKCKTCKRKILFDNKENLFCNRSCAASFTNINRNFIYSEKGLENLRKIGKENTKFLKLSEMTI